MLWSIPVGSVAGTVVRIHVTFLLFLVWIGAVYGFQDGRAAALDAIVYVILLFSCVVLHEFGHVFAARRYGVRTPDITLFPIGGVANLERIPEKPSQELVIALAGPAVNVAIAGLLYLFVGGRMDAAGLAELGSPSESLASRLMTVNLFLALFNLIPAFPMDGGRVLRALLATTMSHGRATRIAASIGQGLAFLLGFLGLFGNPVLIFIAIFVYLAAAAEAGQAQMQEVARGTIVADAMITQFERLGPQASIDDAVDCLIRTTQKDFPVVDGAGRLRGVLTRDAMILALKNQGPQAPVLGAMTADVPVIEQRRPLEEALKLLSEKSAPAVGVVDVAGRLVGLVTSENLGEMMLVRAARPARASLGGPWGRSKPAA